MPLKSKSPTVKSGSYLWRPLRGGHLNNTRTRRHLVVVCSRLRMELRREYVWLSNTRWTC